jgi:hypothetical protein
VAKRCWAVIVLIVSLHASAYAGTAGFADDESGPASPSKPAGQLGPDQKWIVLASRESLADAVEFARRVSSVRTDVRIFKAVNNWYAVLFGPVTSDSAPGIKDDLVRQGHNPADAYVAGGRRFIEDVTGSAQPLTVALGGNASTKQETVSSTGSQQRSVEISDSERLVGTWSDRAEPKCDITFDATGNISYGDCQTWNWVGYSKYPAGGIQLFNARGTRCVFYVEFFGSQVNFEVGGGCSGRVSNFTLRRK